jgi:hypothetical protein
LEDKLIHGDIVAILTKEEYTALDKPKNLAPKFGFWVGNAMMMEEAYNRIGFSL